MKTVPLYGKKAAGRTALVDDEDYDLVTRFRWNIWEERRPRGKVAGPYARTTLMLYGKKTTVVMHKLITGYAQTDHINHNGLDNRRSNLRPANDSENGANARRGGYGSSQYRGVHRRTATSSWIAQIGIGGKIRYLGAFASEVEAALAYDAAALEARGEFAFLNFPNGTLAPTSAATLGVHRGQFTDAVIRAAPVTMKEWWAQRAATERICTVCGSPYLGRSTRPSLYCSEECRLVRRKERQRERLAEAS